MKTKILVFLLLFIASIIQSYWSMNQFLNYNNSHCIICLFIIDFLIVFIIFCMLLTVAFLALNKVKNKPIGIILKSVLVGFLWFYLNLSIFRDKESRWSTYLLEEELMYTLRFSLLPILILAFAVLFIENKLTKL